MNSPGQSYFTEQLVGNVFQENNLISFGHPEGTRAFSGELLQV